MRLTVGKNLLPVLILDPMSQELQSVEPADDVVGVVTERVASRL